MLETGSVVAGNEAIQRKLLKQLKTVAEPRDTLPLSPIRHLDQPAIARSSAYACARGTKTSMRPEVAVLPFLVFG